MRRSDTPTITRRKRGYLGGTDPYIDQEVGPSGATCKRCKAVYYNKRWYASSEDLPERDDPIAIPSRVLCPGCQRVVEKNPEGYVFFSGRFLNEHTEKIRNLIKREVKKAQSFNPLDNIISLEVT
jgi:NMD protein affecting ribosome stability and mRNA decay